MLQVGLSSVNIRVHFLGLGFHCQSVWIVNTVYSWQFHEMRCCPDALPDKLNAMLL